MLCSELNENVSASFKPQHRKPTTQLQSQCSFNKVDNKSHSCEHVKDALEKLQNRVLSIRTVHLYLKTIFLYG